MSSITILILKDFTMSMNKFVFEMPACTASVHINNMIMMSNHPCSRSSGQKEELNRNQVKCIKQFKNNDKKTNCSTQVFKIPELEKKQQNSKLGNPFGCKIHQYETVISTIKGLAGTVPYISIIQSNFQINMNAVSVVFTL